MFCDQMQEVLLTDFIDGQLESSARKNIEAHLSNCADCRSRVELYQQQVRPMFLQIAQSHAPTDLWQKIAPQLKTEKPEISLLSQFFTRWQNWALPVAATAVIGIFFLLNRSPQKETQDAQATVQITGTTLSEMILAWGEEQTTSAEPNFDSAVENYLL